jgi:hypothetical protein
MFRANINPQTVVNIQLALPKLIITLLLITFSYAIAGFMIDIMYITTSLLVEVIGAEVLTGNDTAIKEALLNGNIFGTHVNFILGGSFGESAVLNGAESIGSVLLEVFDAEGPFGQLISGGLSWVSSLSVMIIFLVAILVSMFRTFFMLLSAYINLLIQIIVSPILLLFNALPGSNSFTGWLKTIAAHLAVFPTLIVMILLAIALMGGENVQDGIGYGSSFTGGFLPPQLPGRGSGNA